MKILKIVGVSVLVILAMASAAIYFAGPPLPENIDEMIDGVLQSPLPEFEKGETGYVQSENLRVWYESIGHGASSKGTILLFMGIANDALGWPQGFIDLLIDAGYHVIRYDYRGTGLSDWMADWKASPYSLEDLASDAKRILDTLKIKKAHLVGISMGGMVAQAFASDFPQHTLTLTSMMSSGDILDNEIKGISHKTTLDLIMIGLKYGIFSTEENTIKMHIAARLILRGDADYRIDVLGTAQQVLYNLRKRNGYNRNASYQHDAAVRRSGSRYEKLKQVEVPCLVMHGLNDPFVPIDHSMKLASVLPQAKTKWIENMGHDIPPELHGALIAALIENFKRHPNG